MRHLWKRLTSALWHPALHFMQHTLGSSGLAIAGYGVLMKVGSGPSVLCFDGASVLIGTLGTGCLASLRISASEEVEEDEEC